MAQAVKVMQKRSAKVPPVSLVISVFNGEKYLDEAIEFFLKPMDEKLHSATAHAQSCGGKQLFDEAGHERRFFSR
jgi:hypothetical protein